MHVEFRFMTCQHQNYIVNSRSGRSASDTWSYKQYNSQIEIIGTIEVNKMYPLSRLNNLPTVIRALAYA